MQTDFTNALILLLVGMISVFVILSLVVLSAKALIYLVNRYLSDNEKGQIKPAIIAAATSVVEEITQGKGKIESIERK